MNNVICRRLGENIHVLNVVTGEIMTFNNISCGELIDLKLGNDTNLEIGNDVRELFLFRGQANTRLCRPNLIDLGMDFSFPTIVNIELNRRCSLRCAHCYIGKNELSSLDDSIFDKMKFAEIERLLNNLKEMGVFCLTFTGGEPFLNKNIREFFDIALKLDFVVEFLSNLQILPEWLLDSAYTKADIGRFQTSVYSVKPEVHDSITGASGSWQKTLDNLFLLKNHSYYVEAATPLMTLNYNDWETTQNFFRNQEIAQNFSWPILSHYYSDLHKNSTLNISPDQFRDFVLSNPDFLIEVDLNCTKPLCAVGKATFCIAANGNVFPCSQLPISVGNIASESIGDIFNSSQMQYFVSKKKDVGINRAYNFCPGQNYTETGCLFRQPQFVLDSFKALRKSRI